MMRSTRSVQSASTITVRHSGGSRKTKNTMRRMTLMRLIRGIVRFFDRKIILPVTKFFVNIGKKLKKIALCLQ